MTTQRENYQAWNVAPQPQRQQPKWNGSTTGKFDGTTTYLYNLTRFSSKTDFAAMTLPPHFVRQQPKYVRGEGKMDGVSTQKADYQKWATPSRETGLNKPQATPSVKDDRYFFILLNN